ncbi:MAG: 4a-hydroxytetrahydrobiopterin dehydratase [Anaerolineales bacterium]|nr:MAG: 4a-hydroxytetrahydrobiopterin dehydratase [Anaerolineales bacterium]
MTELRQMKCTPCQGGEPSLTAEEIAERLADLLDWDVVEKGGIQRLQRRFAFPDFAQALAFTGRVGQSAEEADHHPAILTAWGRVTVTWWTHKIKGLHQNDFIMAAKTDALYAEASD